MQLNITSRSFTLSRSLTHYIHTKVKAALKSHKGSPVKIDVTLYDVNGPKGGLDKQCTIKCMPVKGKVIVVQETRENIYKAIAICMQRVRQTIIKRKQGERWTRQRFAIENNEMPMS